MFFLEKRFWDASKICTLMHCLKHNFLDILICGVADQKEPPNSRILLDPMLYGYLKLHCAPSTTALKTSILFCVQLCIFIEVCFIFYGFYLCVCEQRYGLWKDVDDEVDSTLSGSKKTSTTASIEVSFKYVILLNSNTEDIEPFRTIRDRYYVFKGALCSQLNNIPNKYFKKLAYIDYNQCFL